jgi:hypothetical protein
MEFKFNDGGRSQYFKGTTGDCVTRAIAIATGLDYKKVYDDLNEMAKHERKSKYKKSNSRTGVRRTTLRKYLEGMGWKFVPTMLIGSGCRVHLRADELPGGTIICSVSHHLTCVIDGVLNDTYDCTRDGNRCVYGYFVKED